MNFLFCVSCTASFSMQAIGVNGWHSILELVCIDSEMEFDKMNLISVLLGQL